MDVGWVLERIQKENEDEGMSNLINYYWENERINSWWFGHVMKRNDSDSQNYYKNE